MNNLIKYSGRKIKNSKLKAIITRSLTLLAPTNNHQDRIKKLYTFYEDLFCTVYRIKNTKIDYNINCIVNYSEISVFEYFIQLHEKLLRDMPENSFTVGIRLFANDYGIKDEAILHYIAIYAEECQTSFFYEFNINYKKRHHKPKYIKLTLLQTSDSTAIGHIEIQSIARNLSDKILGVIGNKRLSYTRDEVSFINKGFTLYKQRFKSNSEILKNLVNDVRFCLLGRRSPVALCNQMALFQDISYRKNLSRIVRFNFQSYESCTILDVAKFYYQNHKIIFNMNDLKSLSILYDFASERKPVLVKPDTFYENILSELTLYTEDIINEEDSYNEKLENHNCETITENCLNNENFFDFDNHIGFYESQLEIGTIDEIPDTEFHRSEPKTEFIEAGENTRVKPLQDFFTDLDQENKTLRVKDHTAQKYFNVQYDSEIDFYECKINKKRFDFIKDGILSLAQRNDDKTIMLSDIKKKRFKRLYSASDKLYKNYISEAEIACVLDELCFCGLFDVTKDFMAYRMI